MEVTLVRAGLKRWGLFLINKNRPDLIASKPDQSIQIYNPIVTHPTPLSISISLKLISYYQDKLPFVHQISFSFHLIPLTKHFRRPLDKNEGFRFFRRSACPGGSHPCDSL